MICSKTTKAEVNFFVEVVVLAFIIFDIGQLAKIAHELLDHIQCYLRVAMELL